MANTAKAQFHTFLLLPLGGFIGRQAPAATVLRQPVAAAVPRVLCGTAEGRPTVVFVLVGRRKHLFVYRERAAV